MNTTISPVTMNMFNTIMNTSLSTISDITGYIEANMTEVVNRMNDYKAGDWFLNTFMFTSNFPDKKAFEMLKKLNVSNGAIINNKVNINKAFGRPKNFGVWNFIFSTHKFSEAELMMLKTYLKGQIDVMIEHNPEVAVGFVEKNFDFVKSSILKYSDAFFYFHLVMNAIKKVSKKGYSFSQTFMEKFLSFGEEKHYIYNV